MNTTHTAIRISASDSNALTEAKKVIQAGGIIIYPTDTVYGFGVDATNKTAIKNLNKIKKRTGPLSIIVSNMKMAFSISNLSQKQETLLSIKLGGANTIIVPLIPGFVHPLISGDDNTVGIRIPQHSFGTDLVSILGKPITTTSVNISGRPPLNNSEKIMDVFGHFVDLFIDEGDLLSSKGSKILKLEEEHFTVIRK